VIKDVEAPIKSSATGMVEEDFEEAIKPPHFHYY
jgi:hypothetical protein